MTTEQTNTTTDLERAARREALAKASDSIEMAIRECGVMAVRSEPPFMQAVRMAHGIRMIRGALTEEFVKQNFMPLQGSALGFLADKAYDWEVVRDVLCEAMLRGFRPVNNEFNIIAGRFYGAKAGFERIVNEWDGLSRLEINLGVPQLVADKGALVPCEAKWVLYGEPMELACVQQDGGLDTRIPVKVNSGMGPDAILGKATRKLYARIYQRLSGCAAEIIEHDGEAIPTEGLPALAAPEQDGKRIKMGGKHKNGSPDPAADSDGHPEPGANG